MKKKAAFVLICAALFILAHYCATLQRGYSDLGGELVFLMVIPLGLYRLEKAENKKTRQGVVAIVYHESEEP